MPRPYASGVVAAPAYRVWALLREFNGLPGYMPGLDRSELVEGQEGQVGAVRRLTLAAGGDTFEERLLALDDAQRTCSYAFRGANPFGVRRYVCTVRVSEITDTGDAYVEWSAEFDADEAQEEELTRSFAGSYAGGIEGVRKVLA